MEYFGYLWVIPILNWGFLQCELMQMSVVRGCRRNSMLSQENTESCTTVFLALACFLFSLKRNCWKASCCVVAGVVQWGQCQNSSQKKKKGGFFLLLLFGFYFSNKACSVKKGLEHRELIWNSVKQGFLKVFSIYKTWDHLPLTPLPHSSCPPPPVPCVLFFILWDRALFCSLV